MTDEEYKISVAVTNEKLSNLSDQFKRFISHLESEQRVTTNISKRVDQIEHIINHIEDTKNKEQNTSRWKLETVISIVSTITSIVVMLVILFKK